MKTWGWFEWAALFFPALHWLRTYNIRDNFIIDVLAGISVGCMVVPQGMSYANLAGLPQVYGLYGAFVPPLVYSVLGSSRQLAVGPVAVTSLLLGSNIPKVMNEIGVPVQADPNNPTDPEAQQIYNHVAVQVAFVAGCIYTGIGFLRLGWITNFLSHSVVSGFMTGASIQIALSQVGTMLGVSLPRANPISTQLSNIFSSLSKFKWREYIMCMSFITILLFVRLIPARNRLLVLARSFGPLGVCILSIAVMNIFDLYKNPTTKSPYIKRIGEIPSGMPEFTGNWWTPLYDIGTQISTAVLICFIDLCESISIAKALAQKNGYKLNATQELRAIGIANLAGALFNCYTTTGSFSRSAVNNAVGAKTQLASFTTGIVLMIVLLCLTPVFKNMSKNVQAAIIIVGVLQLVDYEEFFYLLRVSFLDLAVWFATFITVLFVSVEWGICTGVCASIAVVVFRSAFPLVHRMGRIEGTNAWRPVTHYTDADDSGGYAVVSVNAPLYFANVELVRTALFREIRRLASAEQLEVRSAHHTAGDAAGDPTEYDDDGGHDARHRAVDAGLVGDRSQTDRGAAGEIVPAAFQAPADGHAAEAGAALPSGSDSDAKLDGLARVSEPASVRSTAPLKPAHSSLPLRYLILDLSSTPTIDAPAVHFFNALVEELNDYGARLVLANPSAQIVGILRRARALQKIGLENVHFDVQDAVSYVEGQLRLLNDFNV